jgi:hypothetical protein
MIKKKYPLAFTFVIGFTFLLVATVQADCPADIAWYWTLNEKVAGVYADSLNVKPGTGADDPVPTAGIIQGAQLFDGDTTGIEVSPGGIGLFGDESFTFEMWVKNEGDLAAGAQNTQVAFGRDDSEVTSLQYFVGIRDDDGPDVAVARLQSDAGEGATTLTGTTDVTDGDWHYIVFVRNNALATDNNILYVDGQIEATLTVDYTGDFGSATAPITIGYLADSFRFDGAIDEVAVYKRALPQSEIQQHFNAKRNYCGETALETLAVGDLNGDGRADLAGVQSSGQVYYSTYLSTWVNIPGNLQSIVTGDFNGDGDADLAGVNSVGKVFYTTDLETWTNIPGTVTTIVTGDFNGDGDDDIAGINPAGVASKVFYTTNLSTWTPIPGLITSIVAGDFDGNGTDDIAGINPNGVISKIFYTTDLTTWTPIPGLITSIAVGDFNGDGDDDIAGINPNGVISKIFYTTDLTTWTPIPGLITSIAVGDFNGDGDDDIAGINPAGVVAKIFYTTDLENWVTVPGVLDTITTGDFDDDGNDDLAGVNSAGKTFYTLDLANWNYIP